MENHFDVIIIGAGISGLSVSHFIKKMKPGVRVLLLEKDSRPGGVVRSFNQDGYLAEWGPHGFLDNTVESRELLVDTGLDKEIQKAPLADFVRYICLDGKLALIPQNPKKIIASSLIPITAKLRVLADLWKKPVVEEQTVSQWVAYRFGRSLLPFADAVFTGTYAGDFERLSIDAVMPGVRAIEQESGSVIRGLLQKRTQKKVRNGGNERKGLPAMVSFAQGMERLPRALAEKTPIIFNTAAKGINQHDGIWEVMTEGKKYLANSLVLALSVNQTLALLETVIDKEEQKPPVLKVPEANIANVVMGFTSEANIPFGFGYLAPEQEKRFSLGALFSSHMFQGRAPEGHVLLEALVGGRRHPDRFSMDDNDLVHEVYEDLRQLIDLPEPPCFAKVLRPLGGIPQLELGYPELLKWCRSLETKHKGLHVCGFGWGGVGLNDMIKSAKKAAEVIASGDEELHEITEVKKVYF